MSWLNGKCREVSSPVDRDTLSQDGVQTLHLLPRQNTTAPALLRHIRGGHGEISPVKTQVCSMDVSWMPRLCDVRRVRFKVERQFKIKAWIWKVILSTKQNPNICLWTQESVSHSRSTHTVYRSFTVPAWNKPTNTFKPPIFTYAAQLVSFMNN